MSNKVKNDKQIVNFDYSPGLHIDLTDQPCSIFIDPKSSIIFMDEGDGDDRMNGAVIFPEDKPLFEIREIKNSTQYEIYLNVQNKHHHLGYLAAQNLINKALNWCNKANEQIHNHNLEFSNQMS